MGSSWSGCWARTLPGAWPGAETSTREDAHIELDFRSRALQLGFWLGWISIVAVLAGLGLGIGATHPRLVLGLTFAAAGLNAIGMFVPWREWLPIRRGRVLLDLWSGGLIGFVALLVFLGGANFTLLLFLAIPFIAVVQIGWRRGFWLTVSAVFCTSAVGSAAALHLRRQPGAGAAVHRWAAGCGPGCGGRTQAASSAFAGWPPTWTGARGRSTVRPTCRNPARCQG